LFGGEFFILKIISKTNILTEILAKEYNVKLLTEVVKNNVFNNTLFLKTSFAKKVYVFIAILSKLSYHI